MIPKPTTRCVNKRWKPLWKLWSLKIKSLVTKMRDWKCKFLNYRYMLQVLQPKRWNSRTQIQIYKQAHLTFKRKRTLTGLNQWLSKETTKSHKTRGDKQLTPKWMSQSWLRTWPTSSLSCSSTQKNQTSLRFSCQSWISWNRSKAKMKQTKVLSERK